MSDDPGITAIRLREVMEETGADQGDVAMAVKCTQGTISQILLGHTRNSRFLPRIADNLGVHLSWLLGTGNIKWLPGFGPQVEEAATSAAAAAQLDAVLVPQLGTKWGMGGGRIDIGEGDRGAVVFSRSWLKGRITGTVEDVVLIEGEGNSMEPTIRAGDVLLVDRAQQSVRQQDDIWAIALHDVGMVKRLRRRKDGYDILSDNPAVPADRADDGEMAIVGRVIWIGRWQ